MGAKLCAQQNDMKFKKLLLLFVFATFTVALAGCTGEAGLTGPAGPAGPAGADGVDGIDGVDGVDGVNGINGLNGADGLDGANGLDGVDGINGVDGTNGIDGTNGVDGINGLDGLSAFDIYMLNYPGYEGTESDWIMELSTNGLVLTLTVVYNNGVTEEVDRLNGDVLGDSPYEVNWYLEAAFTTLANETYITEDMEVYINLASDDLPEPTLEDVYVITDLEEPEEDVYQVLSGEAIFVLDQDVILYDKDGEFIEFGAEDVWNSLDLDEILAEITVVDGNVVELRYASDNVMVESNDDDVVVNEDATTHAITIEVVYGTTVLDLINALDPTDGREQVLTVYDDDQKAVTTGTTVLDYGFTVKVLAEDEDAEAIFAITFKDDPSDTSFAVVEDYDDIFLVNHDDDIITVRPGTSQDELAATFESIADYDVTLEVVNSEFEDKQVNVLSEGDKFIATAIDGTTDVYIILVEASNDVAIEFDGDAVTGNIEISWNFAAADVVALVTSANEEVQSYELQVDLNDGEGFVAYVADSELIQDGDYKLVVTAEDGTTQDYFFTINDSESTDIEVIAGAEHEVTDLDNDDLTVSVRYDLEVADLTADVQAVDGSTIDDASVFDSEGNARTNRVYTGDQLVITAEDETTEAIYIITVDEILDDTDLYLVDDLVVIDELDGDELVVFPQWVDGTNYVDTVEDDAQVLIDELDFESYGQGFDLIFDDEGTLENWGDNDGLENLIIRVYAQDYTNPNNDDYDDDEGNFEDYAVVVNDLSDNDNVVLYDTDEEVIIKALRSSSIDVYMHWENGQEVDEEDILAELDFAINFQTYTDDGHLSSDDYVITVISQDGLEEHEYTVNLIVSDDTDITLVDEPAVIDYAGSTQIEIFSQWINNNGEYEDTDDNDIFNDIDLDSTHQQSVDSYTREWNETTEEYDYIAWNTEFDDDMYIGIVPESGEDDIEYYKVILLDADDELDIEHSNVNGAIEWSLDDDVITVEFGATVEDLEEAIDLAVSFQTMEVFENDGTQKAAGDELFNYNYVTITAQDETTKDYTIMVADEVVDPTPLSDDTDVSAVFGNYAEGDEVADLLDDLANDYADMSFEIFTSEGLAKTSDLLYNYDYLVVTAEDGTTTETYVLGELH